MDDLIECRDCQAPSCKGCNIKILSDMLRSGKLDAVMTGNRRIDCGADIVPVVGAGTMGTVTTESGKKVLTMPDCKKRGTFMDQEELYLIIEKHGKWLRGEPEGERANLSEANLSRADLSEANLSRANLSRADLSGANLSRADLSRADLSGANLSGANLSEADLYWADLSWANLSEAYLSEADLHWAIIERHLLDRVCPIACPETGSFIGWKKSHGDYIVKLEITDTAKRSSATGRKCRCSEAKVLAIETLDGKDAGISSVRSKYDTDFVYTVGETVRVENFDDDRKNECAPGIHFFITRGEAVEYNG